jgi:hypothetical protein
MEPENKLSEHDIHSFKEAIEDVRKMLPLLEEFNYEDN